MSVCDIKFIEWYNGIYIRLIFGADFCFLEVIFYVNYR